MVTISNARTNDRIINVQDGFCGEKPPSATHNFVSVEVILVVVFRRYYYYCVAGLIFRCGKSSSFWRTSFWIFVINNEYNFFLSYQNFSPTPYLSYLLIPQLTVSFVPLFYNFKRQVFIILPCIFLSNVTASTNLRQVCQYEN